MRVLAASLVMAFSALSACSSGDGDASQGHPSGQFCSSAESEIERVLAGRVLGRVDETSAGLEALREAAAADGNEEIGSMLSQAVSAWNQLLDTSTPDSDFQLEVIRFRHSIDEIILRCDAAGTPMNLDGFRLYL